MDRRSKVVMKKNIEALILFFNVPKAKQTDLFLGHLLLEVNCNNYLIRKILISNGVLTTLVGSGSSGSANGTGTSACF